MTSTHFLDSAIEIITPDASVEIDCEYVFTYSPGCSAHYGSLSYAGHPAEGPEVEIIGVRLKGRDPKTQALVDLECPDWLKDQIIAGADFDALIEHAES